MSQLNELIQRVQSLYSAGVQSDDSRLTPRHIYSCLKSARATLIRQRVEKNQRISQWVYQTLPCVELIKAAVHDCPCIPSNGCMILRSKHPIPAPITGYDDHYIQSVSSLDGSIGFDSTTFETFRYNVGNKFTPKKPVYFFRNRYLFIVHLTMLKAVPISILAEDPIEVALFPSLCPCPDCECQDITQMNFPFEETQVDPLIKLAVQELIILMKQLGEDILSNSADDTSTAGKMIHQPNQG